MVCAVIYEPLGKLSSKMFDVSVVEVYILSRYNTEGCGTCEQSTVHSVLLFWVVLSLLYCPRRVFEIWMSLEEILE